MSADTRDPQLRLYRRLFQGAHGVVALVFCSLLAAGVWKGIREVRPRPTESAPVGACVEEAARLRGELLERLASFPSAASAAEEGRAFENWSVTYRGRLMDARARCRRPEGATEAQAAAIRDAFDAVVRTLDLSAIAASHWARHLGPSLDETTRAIEAARKAL